jgi:hypothetical protein
MPVITPDGPANIAGKAENLARENPFEHQRFLQTIPTVKK